MQDNSSIQFIKNWSNSSFFKLGYNSNNIYSAADWDVTVKKNTLLIFPSELSHKVKKKLFKKKQVFSSF